MSESARGEGGRVWVPRTPGDTRNAKDIPEVERRYFLEEKYPAYGNLVPRDIATREIFQICLEGFCVNGENQVYLDLTHLPAETLTRKLGAILEIYEMFVGDDPRFVPMRIFPGVHYSMGGLWVDFEQRTNIPGLFAAGELFHAFMADSSPRRQRLIMRKTSNEETPRLTGFTQQN
jgi:succinate dehydrogenase / fumarate reductase flavoprotein subunit